MDKGSIVRLVLFILAWTNTFLVSKGYDPIPVLDETQVALAVTLVISSWGWVKHNFIDKKGTKR